jgi:hypothetical protein
MALRMLIDWIGFQVIEKGCIINKTADIFNALVSAFFE